MKYKYHTCFGEDAPTINRAHWHLLSRHLHSSNIFLHDPVIIRKLRITSCCILDFPLHGIRWLGKSTARCVHLILFRPPIHLRPVPTFPGIRRVSDGLADALKPVVRHHRCVCIAQRVLTEDVDAMPCLSQPCHYVWGVWRGLGFSTHRRGL